MEYSSYIPTHYWPSNEIFRDGGYGFESQSMLMDRCGGYNKNMIWWIMQHQESAFRSQVMEMHKLYGRQRVLMEEMKLRQNLTSELSYSSSSQAFSGMHQQMLPMNLIYGQDPQRKAKVQHLQCSSAAKLQDQLFSASRVDKNVVDLELLHGMQHGRLDEHVDTRNVFDLQKEKVQAGLHDSNEMKTDFLLDLNEPIQMELPVSSSVNPYESRVVISDNSNLVMDFDLNSVPNGNDSTSFGMVICDGSSPVIGHQILEIDLNSTIPEDEHLDSVDPIKDADSICPISPQNQEAPPPRCESEDTGQESPHSTVDIDSLAAKTLVIMSGKHNHDESLHWFAEIASSADDNHDLVSKKHRKSSGKQVDSGEMKQISVTEGIKNPKWKLPKQCKSWGKTRKRERGCRRRRTV